MWAIILGLIVIMVAFAFNEYKNIIPAQTNYASPGITAGSFNNSNTILADNDWQKVLVGTGAVNSANTGSLSSGTTLAQSVPLTETEKLGQSIVSDYLQLKQSGGSASTSTINAIIAHALNNSDIVTTAKAYDFSDIKIGKDDSVNADSAYGNGLVALFNKNTIVGDEAVYARDGVEQNNPTILAKIDPIITAYQNILGGLLGTTVPPSLAKIHLDLINAMSQRLLVAKLLRNVQNDPAAGLQGVAQYLPALQNLSNAFNELQQFFNTLKISLSKITATSSLQRVNQ
jgi:hypothetical protein